MPQPSVGSADIDEADWRKRSDYEGVDNPTFIQGGAVTCHRGDPRWYSCPARGKRRAKPGDMHQRRRDRPLQVVLDPLAFGTADCLGQQPQRAALKIDRVAQEPCEQSGQKNPHAKLDTAVPADSSTEARSVRCSMVRHRKRTARASAQETQPRGFDYGCLPYVMALASLEFSGHLSAASVAGVAYGSVWSEAVNWTVPAVSLVAQRGDELAKAFEEFNAWSQMTDPDSVEITFVFRKSGGYLLAISPEYFRLERRCLGFDRAHRVMGAALTWIKQIDSVQPSLLSIRRYCSAPIAPFVFSGVTYVGPQSMLTPSSPPDVNPILGLQPLLKFEVTFIDEDDVTPNSTAWIALKSELRQVPKSPTGPPKIKADDIAKQRVKTLAHHFPVTLERIRRSLSVRRLMLQLAPSGVRPWQIEQALCNLVLSAEMGRGAHFIGLSARKAESGILQAIKSRHELADGGDIPTFSTEDVSKQVIEDGNALLRYLKKKRCKDLAGIQAALQSESTLDAATAVDAPAKWDASL